MDQVQTHKLILEEIKSLEPLPEVAHRVLQLSQDDEVVPRDLVGVIQTDAGITAKVLKLCNSALFGFQREIASLPEAGNLLGVSTLVNLVLTSCAGRYFRDYGAGAGAGRKRWEDSVSSALASSLLAGLCEVNKPRAYTAGLLMNVGHLVLDRFAPETQAALEAAVAGGMTRLEAERAVLGIDHAELGARLAEHWQFPAVLVDAIRHHHTPDDAEVDPALASVAHLGELFTTSLEMGEGLEGLAYELNHGAAGLCGIDRTGFETIEDLLRTELAKARELIEL